jgi:hypothetical protein
MKQVIVFCCALLLISCMNDDKKLTLTAGAVMQADTLPGFCPYLTKDTKGHPVLSWVRALNDTDAIFCFAVSQDGRSFGQPITIPSSNNIEPHSENLPKIIFKPSGEIIALWGAKSPGAPNKYAGRVFYAQSFDDGQHWTSPKPLVSDTAGYDQRYYDIALLPNGEAAIIWLDNRKTIDKEGSGLYLAETNGKDGFQRERLISEPCCQCCRTDLFIDPKGAMHVLYRGIINDSIRDMVHAVSSDAGKTFSTPQRIYNDNWVIRACPHTGPAMTANANGLHFAWFTGGKPKGCFYTQSNDNGAHFANRDSISLQGSHPQLVALEGGDIVVVWDESVQQDNKLYKRIGIQKRNAAGVSEGKGYITTDTGMATYPVIEPMQGKTTLIAFLQKKGEKNYINYQLVNL